MTMTRMTTRLSEFPKTTWQNRRSDDEDASLIYLQRRKYGHSCSPSFLPPVTPNFYPICLDGDLGTRSLRLTSVGSSGSSVLCLLVLCSLFLGFQFFVVFVLCYLFFVVLGFVGSLFFVFGLLSSHFFCPASFVPPFHGFCVQLQRADFKLSEITKTLFLCVKIVPLCETKTEIVPLCENRSFV